MTREEREIIEAIKSMGYDRTDYPREKVSAVISMAIEALSERTGQWIDVNGDGSLWKCDQCNDTACCMGNFCLNCGADMRNEVM